MNGSTAIAFAVGTVAISAAAVAIVWLALRYRGGNFDSMGRGNSSFSILPVRMHSEGEGNDTLWLIPAEDRDYDDRYVLRESYDADHMDHTLTDHGNLPTAEQVNDLVRRMITVEAQYGNLLRRVARLERIIRRLRMRITAQFPWDIIGFFVGGIIGAIYDAFLPAHYYKFPVTTNVYVSLKLVKIDHILITDPLKLFGVVLGFAVAGLVLGRVVQHLLSRRQPVLTNEDIAELDEPIAAEDQP